MSRSVAILGLGARGLRWAGACTRAGWDVAVFDPDDRAGLSVAGTAWRRETTISATVRRADWVIFCLPERLELIQMVIQRVQSEARDGAVLAVASHDHDVEAIQGGAIRPGQIVRVLDEGTEGVALDVSSRNDETVRAAATEGLAELAAVLSLEVGEPPVASRPVGREA